MKALLLTLVLCGIGITSQAQAQAQHQVLAPECNVSMPCEGGFYSERAKKFTKVPFGTPLQHYNPKRASKHAVPVPKHRTTRITSSGGVIGGRPAGCPYAFCGCSASLYLFGKIRADLNLAANWLRFPHVSPAPRMAAARRGHVMVLVEDRGRGRWLVHDGNSGGHMTRLHERSLAGYTIVNPNG